MKKISKRILSLLMSLVVASGLVMTASAGDVVYGDLNKDNNVNSIDALMVLMHSVQASVLPDELIPAADVNGDGRINSVDALEILMFSVGNLPYFSAEITVKAPKNNNEILALYNNALVKAREDIPAYKLAFNTKATDLKLSGTLVDALPQENLDELKGSMLQEESYSNIYRQGTSNAMKNLPLLSGITDASAFKSVSYERLSTGEYSVMLKLKDEKNPTADSTVVKLFGLPDYETMVENMAGDTSISTEDGQVSMTVKVGDMYYKNGYISFILDPRTGEFVSIDMSVDMSFTSKTAIAIFLTLNMDATMRTSMKYTNFIY